MENEKAAQKMENKIEWIGIATFFDVHLSYSIGNKEKCIVK